MPYDHFKQYRCTIVRGKAFKHLDNLLLAYANIVNDICPCKSEEFDNQFNERLSNYIGEELQEKTLSNHRTEIVGKLFGMYYKGRDGIVYCSPRVYKLLEDSDQPAYFKELLMKYQFPTGMSKMATVLEQVNNGISIRQFPFVIKLLLLAKQENITLTKLEIGYYALNNLDVLTSNASPEEVLSQIKKDHAAKFKREIREAGKASSYLYQHINEQLNLLVLANLIYYDYDKIIINEREHKFLEFLANQDYKFTQFNFENYDLEDRDQRGAAETEWDIYFAATTNQQPSTFQTSANAISRTNNNISKIVKSPKNGESTVEIGDEGEEYVYNYEISRISKINPRLTNRIKLFGKVRGLGYDIHSIYGEGKKADFVKYIEVKSTKRITSPDDNFTDSINLTRNEWTAAQQHGENYHIYRLYLTNDGVKMFVITNPFEKSEHGSITIEAVAYRAEFDQNAGLYINE